MKHLLMLAVIIGLFNVCDVNANIIDSPVYEGSNNTAVSIGRGQEWSAQNATFINNSSNFGGAIGNSGYLYLYGDNVFKNNSGFWGGGAIDNGGIAYLLGSNLFEGNVSADRGGAILSGWYTILQPENENGKNVFKDNKAYTGGAIAHMSATLFVNNALFINNRAEDTRNNTGAVNEFHQGGALLANGDKHFILNSEFRENHAYAGGAILTGFAQGLIGPDTSFGGLTLYNTSFYDNKAVDKGGAIAAIGATIIAAGENGVSEFKGNKLDNGKSEAIYMTNEHISGAEDVKPRLVLKTLNGGKIIMHDDIDGNDYDIDVVGGVTDNVTDEVIDDEMKGEVGDVLADVKGEGNGEFYLLGKINNVINFKAWAGSTIHLGLDAAINTANYISDNATLKLDIASGSDSQSLKSGMINVSGDVIGSTNVIVNLEDEDVAEGAATKFVNAPNDNPDTESAFTVARVEGNPYMWDTVLNAGGETSGSHWYLQLAEVNRPDVDVDVEYAPEIAAYVGIHSATIEQNRNIANSVIQGLAFTSKINCGYDSFGRLEVLPRKQAWINTSYENADIKAPSDMDVKIDGVTAGVDFYRTTADRAGVFAAYRHGRYELSGEGDYYSGLSSDIKNKSWLGGLYYKRSYNNWTAYAMMFAGRQNIDVFTEDHAVSADTEATQYGASANVGKIYSLDENLFLTPELSLYYTAVDTNTMTDNAGKSANFDVIHYAEAELGAKLEYQFCTGENVNQVYVKPSILQALVSGNDTILVGKEEIGKAKTYKNHTLGRAEFGGELGINAKFSGYGRGRYSFGSDYEAYDFMLGLNYVFN